MQSNTFDGQYDGAGKNIAVVRSRFNEQVTRGLRDACTATLEKYGVAADAIVVVEVPGAFEIPFAVSHLLQEKKHDAIIALGAVVKGETKHDEYIAHAVSQQLMALGVEHGVPVIFGVLTPNTMEQAVARSSDDEHNKGREAALVALEMMHAAHNT